MNYALVIGLTIGAVARVLWDRYLYPIWDELREIWEG